MYRFLAALFLCVLLCGTAVAENLSPAAFTAAFAKWAAAAMPDASVKIVSDLRLETRGAVGGSVDTDLGNAYEVYLRDPSQYDDVVRRYLSLLVETVRLGGAEPPVDRSHILPIFKTNTWVADVQAQRKSAPDKLLLTEPFNSELTIAYIEDRPSSIRYLMPRDGVGEPAQLHALALANLHNLMPEIKFAAITEGLLALIAGGDYEASLLLRDDIWSSGQIKVDGDIVAAVPLKNALVVTGSRNATGLAKLHQFVADVGNGPYALTTSLFVRRDGKFVVFDGK